MLTNGNLLMDMNKNWYKKPVQTPSRGAEVANPECVKIEERLKTTAARGPIPRNGTINKTSWPKDVNKNRYEKPVQTPYWGAKVTNPDCITFEQKIKTTAARCPIPPNGMTINRSWPKDINRNRYEKPVQTPSRGADVKKPDCVTIEQRMKTTAAEVCGNLADKAEPSRCQETAVAAVGARTGGTNKRSTTARTLPTNCGEFVKPMSGLVPPVVTETAPTDCTGVMHYQWNVRESVKTTEMLMPSNYLEIPELRLPRVFLQLAEEARNVKVENGLSCCSEEVQPQGTGLPSPVLVTVMVDSQPIPKKRVLRTTGASTEMMTNINYVGRCKPIDWADQVVSPGTTEQPVLLGLNTDERGNASTGTGGPDVNSAKQSEPVDRSGPVGPQSTTEQPVLLGPKTDETGNTPVDPVGFDVNSTGQGEPVDRSGPQSPQSTTEQSVLLSLKTDGTENAPVDSGGPDMNSAGRGEPVCRPGLVGPQNRTERSVSPGVHCRCRSGGTRSCEPGGP